MLCIYQLQFNMTGYTGKINEGRKLEFSTLQIAVMELKPAWHQFLRGTLQDLWTDTET